MKVVLRKFLIGTVIIVLSLILLVALVILAGRIIHRFQSKVKSPDGIQENVTIHVNGIEQQLSIRGDHIDNPIILFLHGGPANPMGYMDYVWQPYLSDQFTIVTYDQRGSGSTYYSNETAEVSKELLIRDIDKTVDYIRERFGQDKIIIMGHSWGTLLGTLYVHRYPEKVSSYIGVAQIINCEAGEDIAFNETIRRAEKANDVDFIDNLTKAYKAYCLAEENNQDYDTYHSMIMKYLKGDREKEAYKMYLEAILSPEMSLQDLKWFLIDYNKVSINKPLKDEMDHFNANEILQYQIPMYFISGSNDFGAPLEAVQAYYEKVSAPQKNIAVIEGAGHATFIDLPEEFAEAVKYLLHMK